MEGMLMSEAKTIASDDFRKETQTALKEIRTGKKDRFAVATVERAESGDTDAARYILQELCEAGEIDESPDPHYMRYLAKCIRSALDDGIKWNKALGLDHYGRPKKRNLANRDINLAIEVMRRTNSGKWKVEMAIADVAKHYGVTTSVVNKAYRNPDNKAFARNYFATPNNRSGIRLTSEK